MAIVGGVSVPSIEGQFSSGGAFVPAEMASEVMAAAQRGPSQLDLPWAQRMRWRLGLVWEWLVERPGVIWEQILWIYLDIREWIDALRRDAQP